MLFGLHSAGYILFPLGLLSHIGYFENRIPLKPALGVYANYSVEYEETQSNQVFDFRNFVCSMFSKAVLFDFYLLSFVPHLYFLRRLYVIMWPFPGNFVYIF